MSADVFDRSWRTRSCVGLCWFILSRFSTRLNLQKNVVVSKVLSQHKSICCISHVCRNSQLLTCRMSWGLISLRQWGLIRLWFYIQILLLISVWIIDSVCTVIHTHGRFATIQRFAVISPIKHLAICVLSESPTCSITTIIYKRLRSLIFSSLVFLSFDVILKRLSHLP